MIGEVGQDRLQVGMVELAQNHRRLVPRVAGGRIIANGPVRVAQAAQGTRSA